MDIAYFPGCTLHAKATDLDRSARAAAELLGIRFVELSKWSCCGASFPTAGGNLMTLASPVRALAQASREGGNLITLCAICYNVLKRTNHLVSNDTESQKKLAMFTDEDYSGQTRVVHLLELLRDEVGLDRLRDRLVSSMKGLKVAPYYGCLLLRPQNEILLDDPDRPQILENFLDSLGCDVVDFPFKTECCGSFLAVSAEEVATDMAHRIVDGAVRRGAEAIVGTCPLCQFNLDNRQREMATRYKEFRQIPVFYFTQLLALGLGLEEATIGMGQHFVDPRPLLSGKGLL
jgi:heterodisulfide reductase subunit B